MNTLKNHIAGALILSFLVISCSTDRNAGKTKVMKWQDGKNAAISLTYDDGSINQFRVAMPLMDSLHFPATFFIITGDIPGSEFRTSFIGRPENEIMKEAAEIPTNQENLFERASLVASWKRMRLVNYHTQAGELFESGKIEEACRAIDEAFRKAKTMKMPTPDQQRRSNEALEDDRLTWESIRKYASNGHEFASHTISHPRLAVLDEPNMLYELEKSREEIEEKLGPEYTFSAECPYGTEDERVMEYALKIYPALRNRMPETYLEELNRSSKLNPGNFSKEYVQWQRGPLTNTPMDMMRSWIDTIASKDNIWLVLVFHGVEGIGWQPRTKEDLRSYFGYIHSFDDKVWVATFGEVTKYIRERMKSNVISSRTGDIIHVELSHELDPAVYNIPLTLKTYIPASWNETLVTQGSENLNFVMGNDENGVYLIYRAVPNSSPVEIKNQ